MIVDGGGFAWDSGRFEEFVAPDPSYHGVRFHDTFGPRSLCDARPGQDAGATSAPASAP